MWSPFLRNCCIIHTHNIFPSKRFFLHLQYLTAILTAEAWHSGINWGDLSIPLLFIKPIHRASKTFCAHPVLPLWLPLLRCFFLLARISSFFSPPSFLFSLPHAQCAAITLIISQCWPSASQGQPWSIVLIWNLTLRLTHTMCVSKRVFKFAYV